jgi:hypothetical protein
MRTPSQSKELHPMTKHAYIAAAVCALAFSGSSFANDPAKSGSSAASGAPASTASSAQCDTLTGARKEQCMRQARQGQGKPGSATGATSGSGAGIAGSPAKQPNESAPKRY